MADYEEERKHRKRKRAESDSESSDSSSSESRHRHKHRRHKDKSRHSRKHKHKDKRDKKRSKKIEPIDEDDYYRKGTEFREWLRDTHGILWGELKTVVAKEYFETFCELWNKGKLSDRYYKGITSASTDASSRTRHRWNFKDVDMNQLNASSVTLNPLPKQSNFSNTQLFPTAFVRREVDASTNYSKSAQSEDVDTSQPRYSQLTSLASISSLPQNTTTVGGYDLVAEDDEEDPEYKRYKRRKEAKEQREILEELVPKETGRDARIDAKKYRAQLRREQEDNIGGTDVIIDEYEGDRIKEMVLKREMERQRRQQQREAEKASKLAAAREKEEQTIAMLKELAKNAGYNVK